MADSVTLKAYAKINLSLDITGKLNVGGFHTVEMVMQAVDIFDLITVEIDDTISVKCSDENIPDDENNLCFKAAKEFFSFTELSGGAFIKIKKRIPVAAGLGGGSTDAAAVIVGLNMLYKTDLEDDELMEICEKVGSDVPFFINGSTQLAEGTGTILTPLPDFPKSAFLIIKDGEKESTGKMYKDFDSLKEVVHPQTSCLVNAICEGDLGDISKYSENVFEHLYGEKTKKAKTALLENGALTATLSGSGPSVFGLFSDYDEAKDAKDELEELFENIYICEPVACGTEEN